jgi:peroxiredoxin
MSDLLAGGPAVLSFYRGGWCPYCNLELRALLRVLPKSHGSARSLRPFRCRLRMRAFRPRRRICSRFRFGATLARRLPSHSVSPMILPELRPIYTRFGHALPDKNGDESWVLPLPATHVIDTDGTIALSYVDVDYRNRLEPAEILTAIQALSKKHRGEYHANTSRCLLECIPQPQTDARCRRRAGRPISYKRRANSAESTAADSSCRTPMGSAR